MHSSASHTVVVLDSVAGPAIRASGVSGGGVAGARVEGGAVRCV